MVHNSVSVQHVFIITHPTNGTGAVEVITLLACVHTDRAADVGR